MNPYQNRGYLNTNIIKHWNTVAIACGGQYRIRTRVSGLEGHHDIQTTPIALTHRMRGSI